MIGIILINLMIRMLMAFISNSWFSEYFSGVQ